MDPCCLPNGKPLSAAWPVLKCSVDRSHDFEPARTLNARATPAMDW